MTETAPREEFVFVVPVFQAVYPSAFANFMAMCLSAGSREHERYIITPHVPAREILHSAMNRVAHAAIERGCAGIIVADDDCYPPFDAVSRLLRHYEAGHEIVAGMGYMRGYPHTTTIGRYFPEGISLAPDVITGAPRLSGFEWVDDAASEPDDLIKADFCGFPIAMISAAVLKRMKRPWFGTHIDGGDCTHDVYFGSRAKAAGATILVDRTIECGHLTDAPVISSSNRGLAREIVKATKAASA